MTSTVAHGVSIRYDIAGPTAAPVVVLSHSLGTNMGLWAPQRETLAACFRVLSYDIRGHGMTDATGGDYTIELLATDLLALLDRLAIDRVHFFGVSLGGMIGQWLAVHEPRRVGRLILANTAARIGVREYWDQRIETVRSHGIDVIADAAIGRWFTRAFSSNEPETTASFRDALRATPVDGYAGCCAALRDADFRADVKSIQSATLVIAGAADEATTPAEASWLAGAIPKAELVTLAAAHLANVEASEEFNRAVMRFLSSAEA